jgi:hypothetical protein
VADHETATQRRQAAKEIYTVLVRLARAAVEELTDEELRELEHHWSPTVAAGAIDERARRSKAI